MYHAIVRRRITDAFAGLSKVTGVRIYPDTAMLERTLQRIAAKGTAEALAAPITS